MPDPEQVDVVDCGDAVDLVDTRHCFDQRDEQALGVSGANLLGISPPL